MTVTASAPTKLILFGEHFVVYGAPGIAIPITPRNQAEVKVVEGAPGLLLSGKMGTVFFGQDGRVEGDKTLAMFGAVYKHVLENGIAKNERFEALVKLERRCKGIGNSSSIGAALGAAIAGATGKKLSKDEIFEIAQRVDEIAHGSRPSGIDARTIVEGKPQMFRRVFSPPGFKFGSIKVKLPPKVKFLVIDTFAGTKSTTGELVKLFGERVGAKGLPGTLSDNERAGICAPYLEIYEKAKSLVSKGTDESARALGALMNENQQLLRERGVSTEGIERVCDACRSAGALGVKISGAGGNGGAVVALLSESSILAAVSAVSALGYICFPVEIAKKSAGLGK
ncbi:MAG: hypothetical protein V1909_06540 [Candidatus Micrarchaeota archaeon]